MTYRFTAVVVQEGKWFVAHCPELGIASQGESLQEGLDNLKEAIELRLDGEDIDKLGLPTNPPMITTLEIAV